MVKIIPANVAKGLLVNLALILFNNSLNSLDMFHVGNSNMISGAGNNQSQKIRKLKLKYCFIDITNPTLTRCR